MMDVKYTRVGASPWWILSSFLWMSKVTLASHEYSLHCEVNHVGLLLVYHGAHMCMVSIWNRVYPHIVKFENFLITSWCHPIHVIEFLSRLFNHISRHTRTCTTTLLEALYVLGSRVWLSHDLAQPNSMYTTLSDKNCDEIFSRLWAR